MTAQSVNVPLAEAALGNPDLAKDQLDLLALTDKIQFAQLDVKLPQIVVVGEQSAGKSSALEAITGIPFPRNAEACTRFPTEVRLRRAAEESITIRIRPDKNRKHDERKRLRRFGENLDESISFDDLMSLAINQIAPDDDSGSFATDDTLIVEKRGPTMPLLTVVDLPGLVTNKNTQQTEGDIKIINDITDRYMENPRTIVLAVIGGNTDYIHSSILTKARKFDPTGTRTIGVLTKPDLTYGIGLEDKFIALVNNKDFHNHFKLGWYVLLNPGPDDVLSVEERQQKEAAFFKSGKWIVVPEEMRGAAALKQKLSIQLLRHIGRYIPKLQKEVRQKYDECAKNLASLGPGNETVEEMKVELGKLCSDSKELVSSAVHGTYINPDGKPFFPAGIDPVGTPTPNLRARAVAQNEKFAHEMRLFGDKHRFASTSDLEVPNNQKPRMTKQAFFQNHVKKLLQQNTGRELPGDNNPRLVYTLFQDNAQNWSKLAQRHKENIGNICNEFLGEVIDHIWPSRMHKSLRTVFINPQMKIIFENAQTVMDALLYDLKSEVRPYDPEYEIRFKKWYDETAVERTISEEEVLLEKMLIYYELTAKTFIANVTTQVVERHLLRGLLTIFDSVKIIDMQNEKVEAIAAEDTATMDQRRALKIRKTAIGEAIDLCNDLAMRKDLRSYRRDDLVKEEEETYADEDEDEAESRPTIFAKKAKDGVEVNRSATEIGISPGPRPAQNTFDERRLMTPTTSDAGSNSNIGLAAGGDAERFVAEEPRFTTGRDAADRINQPNVAEAWPSEPSDEYNAPLSSPSAPNNPPPPPPASQRVRPSRLSMEDYASSPLSPDFLPRQQAPQHEHRPEVNGFYLDQSQFRQYHTNDSQPNVNSNNPYLQSPTRSRQVRKALGLSKE